MNRERWTGGGAPTESASASMNGSTNVDLTVSSHPSSLARASTVLSLLTVAGACLAFLSGCGSSSSTVTPTAATLDHSGTPIASDNAPAVTSTPDQPAVTQTPQVVTTPMIEGWSTFTPSLLPFRIDYPPNYTAKQQQQFTDELDGHYDGKKVEPLLYDVPPFDTQISITRADTVSSFPKYEESFLNDLNEKYGTIDLRLVPNVREIAGMSADGVNDVVGGGAFLRGGNLITTYLFFREDRKEAWVIQLIQTGDSYYPRANVDFDQMVDTFRFTD